MLIYKANHFGTEKELQKAVEKAYGATLNESEWEHVKPGWKPPYDKEDVKDVMAKLSTKGHKRKAERRDDWWYPAIDTEFISALKQNVTSPLKQRGWSLPVPLEKLRETLLGLGAIEKLQKGMGVLFPLPYLKSAGMFSTSMEIAMLYAPPNTNARLLGELAYYVAVVTGNRYHPAEVITQMLCEIPVFPVSNHLKMFRWGRTIEIRVTWVGIKPSVIAKQYSLARESIIKEIRGRDTGKRVKPKKLSDRTQNLVEFCDERPNLKWEEKLKEWNQYVDRLLEPEEPPKALVELAQADNVLREKILEEWKQGQQKYFKWKFKDVHNMTVVYSRAKKWKF